MPSVIDFAVGALLVIGAFLGFGAALGLVRADAPFGRIQAFAKAGTVAVGVILMGAAIFAGDFTVFMRAVVAAALLLLNSALMAQVLAEWSGQAPERDTRAEPPIQLEVGQDVA